MDGLLLNTEDLYESVGRALMLRRGKDYRDEVRQQMIGLPAPQALELLIQAEGLDTTWQELEKEFMQHFEAVLEQSLALMPGVEQWMQQVDELRLPRCVATSSNREFAERALRQVGILDRMDFVITAEEVERGKPHPDIYHEAAKRMGVSTAQMLVLEDSQNGTKAGVQSGAIVVSVPNQHTKNGNFEGAIMIVRSLLDERLVNWFEESKD